MKVSRRLLIQVNGLIRKIIFSRRISIRMIFGVDVVASPRIQSYCEWGTILLRFVIKRYLRPGMKVLELGTGAHAILAIFCKKNFPDISVLATDILPERVSFARKTAAKNEVDVGFVVADMFDGIDSKFELIISNPPAVPTHELEERGFELKSYPGIGTRRCWSAEGGDDGLEIIRALLDGLSEHLTAEGRGIICVNPSYCIIDEMRKLCQKARLKIERIHSLLWISNVYILAAGQS